MANLRTPSTSCLRRYLLLHLDHVERIQNVNVNFVIDRIRSVFDCRSIVLSTSSHESGGIQDHVAILNSSASRYTASRLVRHAFTECSVNLKFQKSWGSVCSTVRQQPYSLGDETLEQVQDLVVSYRSKRKSPFPQLSPNPQDILSAFKTSHDMNGQIFCIMIFSSKQLL
jgi:hypothetical protein